MIYTVFLRKLSNLTSSHDEELTSLFAEFSQWLIILPVKISDLFLVQIYLASSANHWISLHLSLVD